MNAVRSAKGPVAKKFGTLLASQAHAGWREVAGSGVDVVACSDDAVKGVIEQEIFLDYLAARTASIERHVFLLPEDELSSGNLDFRKSMIQFLEAMSPEAKSSEGGALFLATMKELFSIK